MKIRITSDSTCDLGALVKERNIGIMPLQVNLGDKTYRDGVDIVPEDIFKFVAVKNILPKTAAPSIGEYEEFFKKELEEYDVVIHLNISSKSSGSYNFAKTAAEEFGDKVYVIDSKSLSSGQGLLVMKACDMRDVGKSAEEIVDAILQLREQVNTSFVPDTLEYLHKGGRVSGMVKTVAGMFKIHPLIYMEDGQLVPGKKYKGKMNILIKQYIEDLKAQYPSYDKTRCFIAHSTADKELVDTVKEKIKELFEFDEVLESVAGSIVTSHCGQGTLGVLFIYNK